MALNLITAPTDTPVTLEDVKAHLNILPSNTDDDAALTLYIHAATAHLDGKDGILQRCLKPQTWELTYDEFPSAEILLPLPPLISVDYIRYVDADGDTQTIDAANYVVDNKSVPGWVAPIDAYDWPTPLNVVNAVTVRYTAGYADTEPGSGQSEGEMPSNVPAPIKAAILMIVADWYRHRETVGANVSGIPLTAPAKALIFPFKQFTLA